jgi:glycosidase
MKVKWIFWTILFVFATASCSNMTKRQYLSEYKDFIQQVKKDRQDYTTKNWEEMDKIHYKYCNELFKKYEMNFTAEEKILLAKYRLQYDVYRYKDEIKESLLEIFDLYYTMQSEMNEQNINFLSNHKNMIKEIIDNYVENGLDEDATFLIDQTKKVKGAFSRLLTEIGLDDNNIQDN